MHLAWVVPHSATLPLPLQWLVKRTSAAFPRLDYLNRTALHWAVLLGETKLLRWLLEGGQYRWGCKMWGGKSTQLVVGSTAAAWTVFPARRHCWLCCNCMKRRLLACSSFLGNLYHLQLEPSTTCRVRGEGEIRAIDVDDNEGWSALAYALRKG